MIATCLRAVRLVFRQLNDTQNRSIMFFVRSKQRNRRDGYIFALATAFRTCACHVSVTFTSTPCAIFPPTQRCFQILTTPAAPGSAAALVYSGYGETVNPFHSNGDGANDFRSDHNFKPHESGSWFTGISMNMRRKQLFPSHFAHASCGIPHTL